MKHINKCTFILMAHATDKLQPHIEIMNNEGWEILSISVNNIGIQEMFVILWKKQVDG